MVLGVPGQLGQIVTGAPDRPLVPGTVTALPPDSVVCPVSEKADSAAVATTTLRSAQVSQWIKMKIE